MTSKAIGMEAAMRMRTVIVALGALLSASLTTGMGMASAQTDEPKLSKGEAIEAAADFGTESLSVKVNAFNPSGALAGFGEFRADPVGSDPGDAIRACDRLADGFGIEVRLDINPESAFHMDRKATTRGTPSPFCDWTTGNIAEETPVAIVVCRVRGTEEHCSLPFWAVS